MATPDTTARPTGTNELARSWKRLGRVATFVAILTSPIAFTFFHYQSHWAIGWSVLGTVVAVVAFRGLIDLVSRRFIPWPSLFGASDARLFWYVRLPWALPSVFAGLKLTLIYCTSGAVIGEMIAAQSGLGLLLQTFSGQFDIASVLAVMVILVAVVVLLTSVIELLEMRLLIWSKGSTDVPG